MGVDFLVIKLLFGLMDLLSFGVFLLGVLGGFVLLGLVIVFVLKLIGII